MARGSKERTYWRRVGDPEAGFRYLGARNRPIKAAHAIRRIEKLAIPPAWTDVHIAPSPKLKIQAWGRDAAGRKQYIYSDAHVRRQDRRKWNRVMRYAQVLPELREATNKHLKRKELDREKVLATVVRLMTRAFFRIGSERYAVQNQTFGIATLEKKHIELRGNNLIFTYSGKHKVDQRTVVAETPLVEIIHELMELPGDRLFQYRNDEGGVSVVTAEEVNRYIPEILGERYTSKDLRTFGGTVRAATILSDLGPPKNKTEAKRNLVMACRLVSSELGNTPSVCRSAYIHPAVLEQYSRGRTADPATGRSKREVAAAEPAGYYPEEVALLRFLEKYG